LTYIKKSKINYCFVQEQNLKRILKNITDLLSAQQCTTATWNAHGYFVSIIHNNIQIAPWHSLCYLGGWYYHSHPYRHTCRWKTTPLKPCWLLALNTDKQFQQYFLNLKSYTNKDSYSHITWIEKNRYTVQH